LKFHSFQLLPGIGNSKAIQMVQARGLAGWSSFEEIDEACGIDSVRLLAERYLMEMRDVAQTPRLLDLLVRSEL
jgi:predicted nucleic acid-binding OB-fold protein